MVFITARMTVMKHIKFLILSSVSMFLFASVAFVADVFAANPHFTPMSLLPQSFASASGIKVAGIYWLPDYLKGNVSRGSDDAGGGDIDGNCEKNYGMHTPSNIDGRYICSKYNYNVTSSLKCHVNCRCKDEYKYTSSNCSGNYTTAGTSCEGKYNQCVCKSEFKYNSSNCSGEYEVSGTSCGGNYNGCTIRPECTVSSMSCTYGCAGYNSCDRCTSCKSNPDCDVSDKSCTYGCASYNSCSKCTSCKSNPDCSATAVSCDYGCASTNSCGICTSCSGNPDCNVSDKSCDCGCSSTNSCGKCTSCKSCPPEDPCSGISCGANAYCSGGSCYCNSGYTGNANSGCTKVDTCTYTTTASSCSSQCKNVGSSSCTKNGTTYYNGCGSSKCSSGQTCSNGTCVTSCVSGGSSSCSGQTSSCSSSQVQTASCKDCSGTTRYTCRAKTCEEQGYRYACNNTGYVGKGSPCDGKYKECDCAPGYQWLPTYPGSREQTCQIPDKTCSDSGYYGGSSCSSWSGYSFERCASEYGQMGSSCNAAGNVGSGSCDVDSWRRCCHQCSGSGT